MVGICVLSWKHSVVGEQEKLSLAVLYVFDINQRGRDTSALQNTCKNFYSGWWTTFNFGFEGLVIEKVFDYFNDFNRSTDRDQFVKKTFITDTIEGSLHIKKHISRFYIIVIVFVELVSEFIQ